MLNPQTIAPDFELLNQNSQKISLAQFKGAFVVLYFYPKDDTPGCTKEACGIRDAYNKFSESNIAVLGVSADSPESHLEFAEKYRLPFTLLSDPNQEIIKKYEAYGFPFNKRVTYIIDGTGKIVKAYENVDPAGHAEEILNDIKNLS